MYNVLGGVPWLLLLSEGKSKDHDNRFNADAAVSFTGEAFPVGDPPLHDNDVRLLALEPLCANEGLATPLHK